MSNSWSPLDLSPLVYLTAEQFDGDVAYDLSGNGENFASPANNPTKLLNQINGRPLVRHPGGAGDAYLDNAAIGGALAYASGVVVMKSVGGTDNSVIGNAAASFGGFLLRVEGSFVSGTGKVEIVQTGGGNCVWAKSGLSGNTPQIWEVELAVNDATPPVFRINGVAQALTLEAGTPSGTATAITSLAIGKANNKAAEFDWTDWFFADAVPSSNDASLLRSYLASADGIAI